MNWWKKAQIDTFEMKPEEFHPPGAYYQIGHKSFMGQDTDCREWLWVWNGKDLDIRPTGDMDVNHANLWGESEIYMFKGRVSECDERISISFPKGDRRFQPPEDLIDTLKKKFPDFNMFFFHR